MFLPASLSLFFPSFSLPSFLPLLLLSFLPSFLPFLPSLPFLLTPLFPSLFPSFYSLTQLTSHSHITHSRLHPKNNNSLGFTHSLTPPVKHKQDEDKQKGILFHSCVSGSLFVST
ncbi:hypothetical protein K457DRAFT_319747 [Linnemannia elongata AG-77]|uniref:Uncharacterized protein n=1 Tax=Linnemannia elongata AG-77 TaxID=1314771 RepID=A0A197K3B8_9FUNG|nr:hypothetical protein K457DRAFT_319747 [Linnemannia elongata AG-77]